MARKPTTKKASKKPEQRRDPKRTYLLLTAQTPRGPKVIYSREGIGSGRERRTLTAKTQRHNGKTRRCLWNPK